MTLPEYFELILDKLESNDFELLVFNEKPESDKLSIHIEALNYLLYEWNEDNEDERNIFDYVLKPNDCDWDFTSIDFDEFFDFITNQKDKDNIAIDIKTGKASGKRTKPKSTPKPKETIQERNKKSTKSVEENKTRPIKEFEKEVKETTKKLKTKKTKSKQKKELPVREKKIFDEYNPINKDSNHQLRTLTDDDDWDF